MTTYALIEQLLERQQDCLGLWQLHAHGWSGNQCDRRVRAAGLRPAPGFDGVWTASRTALTPLQRWAAASVTAPFTRVSHFSSSRYWKIGDDRWREPFVDVTRPGSGGRKLHGAVMVRRSKVHSGVEQRDGIQVATPARTIIDLAGHLTTFQLRKMVIEALRLDLTSMDLVRAEMALRPRLRGLRRLAATLDAVSGLPLVECRSNAEGFALTRLKESGRTAIKVNHRIGNHEADFVDLERGEVIELDGRDYHWDTEKDARQTADMEARGFKVTRRPGRDAYDPNAQW